MRFLVIALAVALSLPLSPLGVIGAAQTEAASVAGTATSSTGEILVNATVQLRDLATGTVSGTTRSSSTGDFSFAAVNPGNYVVEILNAAGQVVGTSASISVAAGAAMTGVAVGVDRRGRQSRRECRGHQHHRRRHHRGCGRRRRRHRGGGRAGRRQPLAVSSRRAGRRPLALTAGSISCVTPSAPRWFSSGSSARRRRMPRAKSADRTRRRSVCGSDRSG